MNIQPGAGGAHIAFNDPPAGYISDPAEYEQVVKNAAHGNFEAQNRLVLHRRAKLSGGLSKHHAEQNAAVVAEVARLKSKGWL